MTRAGAGLWLSNGWVAPFASIEQLHRGLELGLGVGFDLDDHELQLSGGSVSLRRAPVSLFLLRRLNRGASFVSAAAGVEVLGVVEHAQAHGLPDVSSGTRLLPGVGARLRASFLEGAPVEPFVGLALGWLFPSAAPAFLVDESEVHRSDALLFGGTFGIRSSF